MIFDIPAVIFISEYAKIFVLEICEAKILSFLELLQWKVLEVAIVQLISYCLTLYLFIIYL